MRRREPAPPPPLQAPEIRIHYLRPPDRMTVYRQTLVHETPDVKITLARGMRLDAPIHVRGDLALEAGSDVVWFTFPGAWHDIGRFHRADGRLTGIYANILTPCIFSAGGDWETTDLFLDLWIPARTVPGPVPLQPPPLTLLDEDELEVAENAGHVSPRHAARARREAHDLQTRARAGTWPPPVVAQWTRDRALEALAALQTDDRG